MDVALHPLKPKGVQRVHENRDLDGYNNRGFRYLQGIAKRVVH